MLSNLDGRVIAIAGVGGGLGPVVAEALAEAGAVVAGTDRDQAKLDTIGAGLPEDRWNGRVVDLLDEEARAPGARGWSSGLGGSTGSFIWSGAGVAGSRCTRSRSRTGSFCTTC